MSCFEARNGFSSKFWFECMKNSFFTPIMAYLWLKQAARCEYKELSQKSLLPGHCQEATRFFFKQAHLKLPIRLQDFLNGYMSPPSPSNQSSLPVGQLALQVLNAVQFVFENIILTETCVASSVSLKDTAIRLRFKFTNLLKWVFTIIVLVLYIVLVKRSTTYN